jgi:phosphate transport system substrate-binding protein
MNIMKRKLFALVGAALLAGGSYARAEMALTVDENLETYAPVSGISGNLNSIGSDSLNNLMTFWAEGFKALYPNVNVQIEGKGSSTAPPALIEGTAQIGPMSRPMKEEEKDKFEKKYGYKPMEIRVAIDALAVYVHKDNPVEGLSLQQVDSIFSSTRKMGGGDISNWGQAGMTGDWANKPISLYGRNSASGTYGFFKEHALGKGDYKASVKEQPGSSAVVQGVGSDLGGIGYSGIGYKTSEVRALPLSGKDGKLYEPSYENCLKNRYPITRFLYLYVNKKPGEPLDPLVGEFMRFILSKQGQEIVIKDGYYPLPNALV